MQITIIGAGAMGMLFGAYLARDGNAVILADSRYPETVSTIARRGITVEEPDGSRFTAPVAAVADAATAARADLFLVFVKTPHTEAALRPLAGRVPTGALVLSLQNGLGNEESIARALGRRITPALGVTGHTCERTGPGTVRHREGGPTIIGLPDGSRPPALEAVAQTFSAAGIATRTTRHVRDHVWQKLLVNAGINALTALAGMTNGELLSSPEMATNVRRLVAEAAAVARAERVALPERDPYDLVRAVAGASPTARSTMLRDAEASRVTEIEAINGAIVRLGERHGIDVPTNRLVAALVRARHPRSS